MTSPLIILDRDGVLNEDSDQYIKHPDEWLPIPGAAEAISRLNQAGYRVAVATNQSGISRGYFDEAVLATIHAKMTDHLLHHNAHIDQLLFCPDHPDNPGPNRKPAPGMALTLIAQFEAIAADTWFVGDTMSDVQCALNAGCKPALVRTGKGTRTLQQHNWSDVNVPVFDDLAGFVANLLD
jgi:D-glycero-D-manno-heptose 1,7-bisphosphate phosphatase